MLMLKNRAVSLQRAQAREINNEFNAVSVTFEFRPILLLINIMLKKIESYACDQQPTVLLFANFMYPGSSFSRSCIFQFLFFFGPSFSGPANSAPPSPSRIKVVFHKHQIEWLSEHLVARGVDEWVDTEVDESKCSKYVEPFIRQSPVLFTNSHCYWGCFWLNQER